jgi:hypothetical protein
MPPFGSMQGRFGGRGVPKRVKFVADAIGEAVNNTTHQLAIPAHWAGDLILAVCGALSSTPPILPAGWTNVHTVIGSTRSQRVFYKISDGTLTTLDITTTWTTGGQGCGCMIFRNAIGLGAIASNNTGSTHVFNTIPMQNNDGTSVVVGAIYFPSISRIIEGTPMNLGTLLLNTSRAMMVRTDNVTAFATTTFDSTAFTKISSTVEVRAY